VTATETALRESVVSAARSLFERSLTHGSTGNISVRSGDEILVTPTGHSLGTLQPDQLSLIDLSGKAVEDRKAQPKPTKEALLHAAVYRARPEARAVVHTHSTHAVAVSCLADVDEQDALPALTAYYAMRVGTLPLLPYFRPGDLRLAEKAERAARCHPAFLLRNHGPVVAGSTLAAAVDALEELEQTARLFLLLRGQPTLPLSAAERSRLYAGISDAKREVRT
jgi:ribulose-5-phosphate 4-epimerase/fuculose-1-phosphate aldolase